MTLPGVIVHGGAGAARMDAARLERYRSGLAAAVDAGYRVLAAGGGALDGVEAAIRSMEASGAFNAGRGSCLNLERQVECDAAVMIGADLRAGAVGALQGFLHPVSAARKVLEETDHVLVVGRGAARLAEGFDLERWSGEPSAEQLAEFADVEKLLKDLPRGTRLGRLTALLRHGAEMADLGGDGMPRGMSGRARGPDLGKADTVGAVAIDRAGRLAAGVSTGGLWLKLPGRVGDSAIPGAGIYADDRTGAACATGIGEAIIRVALCRRATEAMEAGGAQVGLEEGIRLVGERIGPDTAGLIGLDRLGRPGAAFNTEAMGRAWLGGGLGAPVVAVGRDEALPGERAI